MKKYLAIVALLVAFSVGVMPAQIHHMVRLAIAATPTATATATATPAPNCSTGGNGTSICFPAAQSTTAGQPLVSGGVAAAVYGSPPPPLLMTWSNFPFTIGWDGYLGIVTSAATKTIVAPCTGHFTSLSCTASLTGTCTTVPVINVDNVTTPATGTAINLTTTVGTPVTQPETLVFTAGNVIGLAQTASPGTCTVPWWGCEATATCP